MPHSDPAERRRIARAAVATRERNRGAKPKRPRGGPDPPGMSTIQEYDTEVGRPSNWGDVKRREEVRGELILNEARAEDLAAKRIANAKSRGDLVDIKTVDARDEARDTIFMSALAAVVDFVGEVVPPAQIQSARSRAQAWLDERRADVAAKIKAMSTS